MKIDLWPIERVKPYDRNPRLNDQAVDAVAASLTEFGWRQPIVVDKDGVIVVGHTRWKAAKKLGLKKVPVHVAKELTPEQAKAYRLADNQTATIAEWDKELLPLELADQKAAGWIDWVCSEADERAVLEGCYFDINAAERVRTFFRKFLRHSKGQWAGKPFELLDWQWDRIVARIFGWKRADGSRRYRRGYIEVPKKNGKSTLFSGLSLYLLCGDGEPGAEIYSAAVDRDQASIVYNEAANMVEASPGLTSRMSVVRSTKRIVFPKTRSFYKALSADVPAKEGLNAHAVLIDELHAQKTRELWDTLRYAGASRRQPLHLSVTTAGFDRHSICWEQHQYAEQVLTGLIHDSAFFAFISAAAPEDDWTDPIVWSDANPSFGITLSADQFAEDCKEAQQSPAKENSFRRYRLNHWTESDVRRLSIEKWDACDAAPGDLAKAVCWAGLDLSSTQDITALVLVFRDEDQYTALPFFWVPEEGARQRAHRDRVPYQDGIREGYIEATPGSVIDYDRIRAKINELGKQCDILEIAIDRWNATQLATQLTDDGFEMVAFGQGYASMNWPTKKLEEVILAEKLVHGGNPVLRWMAGNVSIETDAADNWKPSKKKSRERIDGIVALIMGLDRASRHEEFRSVYDKRGPYLITADTDWGDGSDD